MYVARCENIGGVKTLTVTTGTQSTDTGVMQYHTYSPPLYCKSYFWFSFPLHHNYFSNMVDESYEVLCDIKSKNKVFRKACSQIILLNHQIESSKKRYDRAKQVRRLSFRYTNRLKLTALEGVRNLTYEFACSKCEEIEILQARLLKLTGDVFDFAESDTENWVISPKFTLGSFQSHWFFWEPHIFSHEKSPKAFYKNTFYIMKYSCFFLPGALCIFRSWVYSVTFFHQVSLIILSPIVRGINDLSQSSKM